MKISSRMIFLFIVFGVFASLAISILISKKLSMVVADEIKARELELAFGAIESGPLAIARMQSSAISQQELDRLMANSSLSGREIISVSIKGGNNGEFEFASWKTPRNVAIDCSSQITKSYNIDQSINPYLVSVFVDHCYVSTEAKTIFIFSSIASVLVAFVGMFLFFIAVWPVAASVNKAEKVLVSGSKFEAEMITFKPIFNLVLKALRSMELERHVAMVEIAAQVSHDIRSPLSALEMAIATTDIPDDRKRILKQVAARIRNVAEDLLRQSRELKIQSSVTESAMPIETVNLAKIVKEIIQENQLSSGSIQCDLTSEFIQVKANEGDLGRIVSNLLNNSKEAALHDRALKVNVVVREYKNKISLSIQDNGRGISPHVLPKVGERGFTSGKANGNGLGVSYAKAKLAEWGGDLQIFSKENEGTLITLNFIKAS